MSLGSARATVVQHHGIGAAAPVKDLPFEKLINELGPGLGIWLELQKK